jgi:hypothetical protein
MSVTTGTEEAHAIARAAERQSALLERLCLLMEAQTYSISVGGQNVDRNIEDFPFPGWQRKGLSDLRISGNDTFPVLAAAAPVQVMTGNPGRLGGQIVNSGSGSCLIYLASANRVTTAPNAGMPALFLSAMGGAWDFLIGNVVWGGAVSAFSTAGTTLTAIQV